MFLIQCGKKQWAISGYVVAYVNGRGKKITIHSSVGTICVHTYRNRFRTAIEQNEFINKCICLLIFRIP